jgi:hypothetical protein
MNIFKRYAEAKGSGCDNLRKGIQINFNQPLHDIWGVSLVTLQSIQAQDH